jgi:oligopeptide transport system permease protein
MEVIDLTKPYNPHDEDDSLFVFADHNTVSSEKIVAPRYSYWKSVSRVFFSHKANWFSLGLLALVIVMSMIYPFFQPYGTDLAHNPWLMQPKSFNLSPAQAIDYHGFSLIWIFGSTTTGNSVFNAVWSGTRTSLGLALICTVINMTIGILLGAVWGYSKRLDAIMNQVYNIVANIPYVLLISVLVYIIGSGFWPFIFALTITGWLSIAYFIRTQVIIIRDREYNLASRCLGTPMYRIVTKNILPYMVSVIVTIIATELPSYIGYEVFLSYIGVGLSADTISIGRLISEAEASWTVYPWQFWPPVVVSAIVSVVLYVVGQNLGDASDPRTHMQ